MFLNKYYLLLHLVFISVIFASNAFGQSVTAPRQGLSPVAQRVHALANNKRNHPLQLFSKVLPNQEDVKKMNERYPQNTLILQIADNIHHLLLKSNEEIIQIYLPGLDRNLLLYRTTLSERLEAKNSRHYRGIVQGDDQSLVTLNVHKKHISGIISDRTNQWIIQPFSSRARQVVLFKERDLEVTSSFDCHSSLDGYAKPPVFKESSSTFKSDDSQPVGPIDIYFECDYAFYAKNDYSEEKSTSYLLDLFNQVAALYENESVTIQISGIKIWQEPDPYESKNAVSAINSFYANVGQDFPGNLAHFISGEDANNGGIAFIDALCDRSKAFGYSNLNGSFLSLPSYSWDVHVLTHELGHNLGSPHTHDCVWGPNGDEPLDNCYSKAGCPDGPAPVDGGTIMSYCHITSYGVNFSLGFGLEPGNLIRSRIAQCLNPSGVSCDNPTIVTSNGEYMVYELTQGSGASDSAAQNASWFMFVPESDGMIDIASCNQGVDTRLFIYSGTCGELTQLASSDDDCASGSGYNYASSVENFSVSAGEWYYFEWDDRWSDESFVFNFLFTSTENPCTQDHDELEENITGNKNYYSDHEVHYSGQISPDAVLNISSGEAVMLDAGFEISAGAQINVNIEDCETFYGRNREDE